MPLRLIEINVPSDAADRIRDVLDAGGASEPWRELTAEGRSSISLLLEADRTGEIVDRLEQAFGGSKDFRLAILPVEASLPRVEEPERARAQISGIGGRRVSREELYNDVLDMARPSRVFLVAAALSTVVAATGMMRDNAAVIIGAMVIAPLLGPNVALSFAATLGDVSLLRCAALANVVGVALALALSAGMGLVLTVDPAVEEIAIRTSVHVSDVVLALAAGSIAALAITTALPAALVGVMVSVALLPPAVALGLMAGSGAWALAAQAGLLLSINVVGVNLAAVITFRLKGVRPRAWWEEDRARRSSVLALGILGVLLALFTLLIVVAGSE